MNVDKAVDYVVSCMNFDGGFGCRPGSESHSGQVYFVQSLLQPNIPMLMSLCIVTHNILCVLIDLLLSRCFSYYQHIVPC